MQPPENFTFSSINSPPENSPSHSYHSSFVSLSKTSFPLSLSSSSSHGVVPRSAKTQNKRRINHENRQRRRQQQSKKTQEILHGQTWPPLIGHRRRHSPLSDHSQHLLVWLESQLQHSTQTLLDPTLVGFTLGLFGCCFLNGPICLACLG